MALLSSCFGILSAFSPNFGMMVFIRALLGFGGAGGGQGCVGPQLECWGEHVTVC